MIDFSRLGRETPEERAARDAERRQTEIDADAKRRAECVDSTMAARLAEDVELRSTPSGDTVATLRCIALNGEAFTAIYWLPPHRADAADRLQAAVIKALENGARTRDLGGALSTVQMGDAVLAALA